jgi:hypothetical protein
MSKSALLFEEYGDKLFVSTDDGASSNSSALTNLTYYQALLRTGHRAVRLRGRAALKKW